EQGALLAAAQLVDSVRDLDSKLYSSSQVVDEARHVDVYNRYVHKKIGFSYPVNTHLKTLLDMILKDSRWDMKFLGMQIMVEGLALAAFGMIRQTTQEPLLKDLTAYAKSVPAIKKMDLLSDRQRERCKELGILQFENWEDPLAAMSQSPTGATSARL